MAWTDRLSETIDFTSPSGREFSAKWRGDNRTKEKKLGQFSPPKRRGTIYQDLDVGSVSYPLNFIFDGPDHDLVASLFFETCSENGTWTIKHPIHGNLNLQLVSVTEKNQPITAANQTQIESQWVEPLSEDQISSAAEIANEIERQLEQLNSSSSEQLEAVSDQSTAARIRALKDSAQNAIDTISNGMRTISEISAEISRITNQIQRATTSDLLNPTVRIQSLATQIQNAIQTPMLATNNVLSRANVIDQVSNSFLDQNPEVPDAANKNTLAIKETALVALTGSLSRVASTGDLETRQEALNLAEFMADQMDKVTNNLDENQTLYNDNLLENRYFSQSSAYPDLTRLVSLGIEFLLKSSFDLKIEKRFTIDREMTPIEVTISEYGGTGENDENLDFFIFSNRLKGKEILLLPAGKEVVVYV